MKVWRTEIRLLVLSVTDDEEPDLDFMMENVKEEGGVIQVEWEEVQCVELGNFDIAKEPEKKPD